MRISGLQELSLIDYPGRLACTVFFPGCNFRCPFCYSSELVLPEKIRKQPQISEQDFFSFLKNRKDLLEGVVLCGGEPSINPKLPEFCERIKKMGFVLKLDTNGSNPAMIEKLINKGLIDYIALDIKAVPEKYGLVSGLEDSMGLENRNLLFWQKNIVKQVEKSMNILKTSGIDYEFRTTVVPGIHTKKDILEISRWISPASKYYLQNFRPEKTLNPDFEKIKPYPDKMLLQAQKAIAPFFDICKVR